MHKEGAKLLRQVAEVIRKEPDAHDQETWGWLDDDYDCGTVACIAGHAVVQAGYKLENNYGQCLNPQLGSIRRIEDVAQELLGLDDAETDILFEQTTQPLDDMSWPEALIEIAAGSAIVDVVCDGYVCQFRDNIDHHHDHGL